MRAGTHAIDTMVPGFLLAAVLCGSLEARDPVPDRLVVLTFDDSVKSHRTVAAPLLARYGFGATFFITEGFTFRTNKRDYMSWDEIHELHAMGFEIGNHTENHMSVTEESVPHLEAELAAIDARCAEHGIPKPISFAWPGNSLAPAALAVLARHGFRFARRGGAPEYDYTAGRGVAYEPGIDHPLLIPSAGDARPSWSLADFERAVGLARDGRVAVLQFHGVPEGEHPWVHTPEERFAEYMQYLHENGYRVIALRDLERYVDPQAVPAEPWNVIAARACALGRVRAADLGIRFGDLPSGAHGAITDVPGVRVGHRSIWSGEDIRTGVTAIVPHGGDVFRKKVPAAFFRYNGYGKPFGTVQIAELGEIETPILLGATLSVPRIADAVISWTLARDASGELRSVNPVVGEVNDGWLSDIRARPVREEHVIDAIERATSGPVAEGAVGAGTGTTCLGYKGGIGTASRVVRAGAGGYTVGALVQTNFGGELRIAGRLFPALGRAEGAPAPNGGERPARDGSCAIVIATDAPLDARQLERLARRAFAGMARTGASFAHGSGDYAFAFSSVPRAQAGAGLEDASLTPLLVAAADAVEEAIVNSLLQARTVTGRSGRESRAIDLERVREAFAANGGGPEPTSAPRR